MKRIIFLNRFFFPDHSASSQLLSDLAFYLAECGRDVHIITSRQLYENAKANLPARETVKGVTVHRIFSTQFGRANLAGRALDYLTFYLSMILKLIAFATTGDVIVAKTDPPLVSIIAMWAAQLRGAKLVNWLQDIYPEIARESEIPFTKGASGRVLSLLRNNSLKSAAANVAVGEDMASHIISIGVTPNRVRIISNWCNDENITPIPPIANPLRHTWKLQEKFVIGYSGNLGRGHEFETMLSASKMFRGNSQIIFLLIGGGNKLEEYKNRVSAEGLDSIYRFYPYQDREMLKYSLSVPDVHWLSLRPALSRFMFPSKFYGVAAAGRPILALTGKDGEIAKLLETYECGYALEPGDVSGTFDAIGLLSRDRALCQKMGFNARAMLDLKFTRARQLNLWKELLDQVVSS